MKKTLAILALLTAVAAASYWYGSRNGARALPSTAVDVSTSAIVETKTLYTCAMHPHYISDRPGDCPFCGMKLTPVRKNAPGTPAQGVFIDPAFVQNMGVKTAKVEKRVLRSEIRAGGRVVVDETRQYSVNARVEGWAETLRAGSVGQAVRQGGTLLELYSPELLAAQEEHLQALHYAREAGEQGDRFASESRRAAAELLESSRRRLLNWGASPEWIAALEKTGNLRRTLPIRSPVSGTVLEKAVVQGQKVMPGEPLYRIADLSRVWVTAQLYQNDLAVIGIGAAAEITLASAPGVALRGTVSFVSPVLDTVSRTAEIRIEMPNPGGTALKPGMLAAVILRGRNAHQNVIAVPEQAILRTGRRSVAVIALGGGYFEPRDVRLGRSAGGYVEVLDGLSEGETLVTSSQFLIDSESNLRAAVEQLRSGK